MQRFSRLGLLAVVVLILALALFALNLPFLGRDFISFWTGAQAIRAGHSPYDQSFQTAVQQANGWNPHLELFPFHPYVYPPWLALLIWPLAWLPYQVAFNVWLVLNLILGAVAVVLLLRVLQPPRARYALPLAWLMTLTYLPVLHGIVVGQTHLVLFFLAAVVIWAGAVGRERTAGVALGLMSIKPQVGLVLAALFGLYWLAQRRWQAVLSLLLTGLICVAVSFLLVPNWVADMLAAPERFAALMGEPVLFNAYRDYPTLYAAGQAGLNLSPIFWVAVAVAVGVLGLAFRHRQHILRSPQQFSALVCAGLFMLTPYARVYELTLLVWPMLYLLFSTEVQASRFVRAIVVGGVYAWPLLLVLLHADGVWNVFAPLALLVAILLTEDQSHAAPVSQV